MLTTTEAADFREVSRPYLTRLLKTGKFGQVETGQVRVVTPAPSLTAALEEDQALIAVVAEHLAANRRGVTTVADVLDELDRNEALRLFVELARARLLQFPERRQHWDAPMHCPSMTGRDRRPC